MKKIFEFDLRNEKLDDINNTMSLIDDLEIYDYYISYKKACLRIKTTSAEEEKKLNEFFESDLPLTCLIKESNYYE